MQQDICNSINNEEKYPSRENREDRKAKSYALNIHIIAFTSLLRFYSDVSS